MMMTTVDVTQRGARDIITLSCRTVMSDSVKATEELIPSSAIVRNQITDQTFAPGISDRADG